MSVFATVAPLPGSTPQRTTVAGAEFPNPVVVRVTDERGIAVSGATVAWSVPPFGVASLLDVSRCIIDLGHSCSGKTDRDGLINLGRLKGGRCGGVDGDARRRRRPHRS